MQYLKCEYRFGSIKQYDKRVSYSNSISETETLRQEVMEIKPKKQGGTNRCKDLSITLRTTAYKI